MRISLNTKNTTSRLVHKLSFVIFYYMSSAVGICKFPKLTLRNRLTPLGHTWFYQFLRDKNRVKTRPSLRTCLPFATFLVLPIKGKVWIILSHFPCFFFFFRSVHQAVNRYSKNKYRSNNYHLASSVVNAKFCSLHPSRGAEGLQLFAVHFRAVLMKQGLGDGLMIIDNLTDNLLKFYTNKIEQHLWTWTYCHLLCLDDNTSSVAYNSGETQTCI